tara:strand:- start:61 stop:1188 length:1128 start_codon:yes stop_codon:yes gene_type:complete
MLQNKIYLNFIKEIFKTFLVVLFGLSLIALTVRAVSFLELIVENGYPVGTYFKYSLLNLFGIAPKFIPLSFLISLTIFILKHLQDGEFIILWVSGVKKIQLVNLFFFMSVFVLIIYLIFSSFLTPMALNKSRKLLGQDQLNSFLPTIRAQQFSDSFKGFTFFVDKKIEKEIQNIFLFDKGNNLKNLSPNISKASSTTIIAKNGIVEKKKLILFSGQIISSQKDTNKDQVIKFEQLNVDLGKLSTSTIKQPKIQETSTFKLLKCFKIFSSQNENCKEDFKKEIIPNLIRRTVLPLYIPIIALICSLLLIKSRKIYFNKMSIFSYSFALLLFIELAIRFTGLNVFMKLFFISFPFFLISVFYLFLINKFTKETKIYE